MDDKELDEKLLSDIHDYPVEVRDHILDCIHKYPELYKSKESVLSHILLGYGTGYDWVKGELKYTLKPYKKQEEPMVTMTWAKRAYIYGYQRDFVEYCVFSDRYSPLLNIPDDVTEGWLNVIKDFLFTINNLNEKEYRILMLASCINCYGINNPTAYTWWNRNWEEFLELRKLTNQLAKDRGWENISVDALNDPERVKKHAKDLGKMIQEILDSAEGIVPGAKKQLKMRDAKDLIRRHGIEIFKEAIIEMEKECQQDEA